VSEPLHSDCAPGSRPWWPLPFCHPRSTPPHSLHPLPHSAIKGTCRATDFPFLPLPPSRHPAPYSTICRRLGSPAATTAQLPSSYIESARRTSPTLLHVVTTCSSSHQSATHPGKSFPCHRLPPRAHHRPPPSVHPRPRHHLEENRMTL
jgi:hypothetical protein